MIVSSCLFYKHLTVFIYLSLLKQKDEEFVFSDVPERPIPSLLRGYSAPIRLESDLTDSDLFFLLAHDSDEFNRYVLPKASNVSLSDSWSNWFQVGYWFVLVFLVGRQDKCWHVS